ncbi:MAG: sulfatase-like hydrolase/transferase [Planctomycetes bacterium]|nr:sulfatase-like hydrolase/transferase [Planctomycetota bacterium]
MAALRSRLHLASWIVLPPIVFSGILRLVLHVRFSDEPTNGALLREFGFGAGLDALVALALSTPVLLGVFVLPLGWLARTWLRGALFAAFYSALVFHGFIEFFFFEEFKARFNHIALDYLLFPGEVVGNVWQSYDVPLFVALALGAGSLAAGAMLFVTRGISFAPLGLKRRTGAVASALVLGTLAVLVLVKAPLSLANERLENELTSNGTLQLVRAFFTGALEYDQYYLTLPRDEGRRRATRLLGFDAPTAPELALPKGEFVPRRGVATAAHGSSEPRAWNVVVVVEESFGAEFVGALGAPRSYTPEFDRWTREGYLLSGLVANGNRTVRGLEGVLAGFVPLPGDAILKRTKNQDVATLARVLGELGWRTEFFYGGRGIFDGMKPFMQANGWESFVEQSDFPSDVFTTAWGAADEHIFDALLERQRDARAKHERLFATLLTVSNHKPYDIPPGNPIYKEGKRSRERAVAYADWALGRWLDACRDEALLADTLVLIVGDHGARVYGAAEIPAGSYRIPALFLAPEPTLRGTRQERLCSQIDLAPTLLGLLGLATPAPFFGRDVRGLPADGGRAFVHHNRDIGMVTDDALVVLGLQKTVHYYRRDGRTSDLFDPVPAARADANLRELALDAASVFQLADELYEGRRYRLEAPLGARPLEASSPRGATPR